MSTTLKKILSANPNAAQHESSIRSALKSVRKLRELGIGGKSRKGIQSPYKQVRDLDEMAISPELQKLRSAYKIIFDA